MGSFHVAIGGAKAGRVKECGKIPATLDLRIQEGALDFKSMIKTDLERSAWTELWAGSSVH